MLQVHSLDRVSPRFVYAVHFERCGVVNHFGTSRGSYIFGWHTSVLVLLHNGCHIMEICTITSVYPEKQQSTENTRRSPATGHTYNFWKYTPFLVVSTFSISGASRKGRVYAILCFTMPSLLCETGKMRVQPSKNYEAKYEAPRKLCWAP